MREIENLNFCFNINWYEAVGLSFCFEFQIWNDLKNHIPIAIPFDIHLPMLDWYQQQEQMPYR